MNPEVKKKWLEALRSGKYQKATSRLHYTRPLEGDSYCCLGVLCELYRIEHPNEAYWKPSHGDAREHTQSFVVEDNFREEYVILPWKIKEWAGLPDSNPEVIINEAMDHKPLAYINDSHIKGIYTFEDIAMYIEEQL